MQSVQCLLNVFLVDAVVVGLCCFLAFALIKFSQW